jgi:hypothetical protein
MSHFRQRVVRTRYWDTQENPGIFPECHDFDYACAHVQDRRDFGVAFSGGGTRSASATLGQLRALRNLGWLERLGYVSAVSGGSWASVPFEFLPPSIPDERFLGPAVLPGRLGLSDLDYGPKGSLAHAISKTVIGDDFFRRTLLLGGDEAYSRAIGDLFLKPFDLHDRNRFFTFYPAALDKILEANSGDPDYYLTADDFYGVQEGRPFLIVAGTLLRARNSDPKRKKMLCEYTPLYAGVRCRFDGAGRLGRPIGGGYVQSFAYDTKNPEAPAQNGLYQVEIGERRYQFTLSDVVGSSGAAPEETVRSFGATFLGFPEFRHWPVADGDRVRESEYPHGDGGHLENFGIMPLLMRGVERIIVFVNTPTPLFGKNENGQLLAKTFTDDLGPLFGRTDNVDVKKAQEQLACNQVFAPDRLDLLVDGLKKRQQQGAPLVHAETYAVRANDHFGIRPYSARICWVYNSPCGQWNASLPSETRHYLENDKQFVRFPNYKTFGENPPNVIDLSLHQVNMLAHFAYWQVAESKDYIEDALGIR